MPELSNARGRMAKPYQHIPLQSLDSIRVIELLPASNRNAPVQCGLYQMRFKEARSKYEALSYVWGDAAPSRPIMCDGCELLVTQNCLDAMIQLRRRFRVRNLWIDAVCIDQRTAADSTKERNHQVKYMGEIYENASNVIIWLGLHGPRISMKFHAIFATALISKITISVFCFLVGPIVDFMGVSRALHPLLSLDDHFTQNFVEFEIEHHIFKNYIDNPWFTRVWTVQEASLARKRVLRSGSKRLYWPYLHAVCELVGYELSSEPVLGSSIDRIRFRGLARQIATEDRALHKRSLYLLSNDWSVDDHLQFLQSMKSLDSKLPHDKVYGVLSILRKMNIQAPDPDYSEPLEQVLEAFTRACVLGLRNLDLITSEASPTTTEERPSWIPNYLTPVFQHWTDVDVHGLIDIFPHGLASGSSYAYISYESLPGRLPVKGKMIGTIETLFASISEQTGLVSQIELFRDFIQTCREWCLHCSALPDGDDIIQTSRQSWQTSQEFREWRDIMLYPNCRHITPQEVAKYSSDAGADPVTIITNHMLYATGITGQRAKAFQRHINRTANWAFVMTDNQHSGRAYRNCQKGDQLWLLAGSKAPVILRPARDGFRYITPAHMPMMMKGELWPRDEEELEMCDLV